MYIIFSNHTVTRLKFAFLINKTAFRWIQQENAEDTVHLRTLTTKYHEAQCGVGKK